MPFISVNTNVTLDDNQKLTIAKELGKEIEVIPGKNAGNLQVEINDQKFMVFGGDPANETIYTRICLHQAAEMEAKEKFILACYKVFCGVTGIPENNIYITIEEFDNWGALGRYL